MARSSNDLLKAVQVAEKLSLPYLILGGGSNILISDNGFAGLVIKARNEEFIVRDPISDNKCQRSDLRQVVCGAGLTIHELLKKTLETNLTGLEFMAGIYGTVGGAVCGNAGAYGKSIGDLVQKAQVYKDGKLKNYTKQQMKYSYRSSVIKETGGVIIAATLVLQKGDTAAAKSEIKKTIDRRAKKFPAAPCAGSIFKNIELKKLKVDKKKIAKALDVTAEEFRQAAKYKLPVGFIIDKLNLKGKQIGGAAVSEKHGNIIINKGNATAEEVIMLISYIKKEVRDKLGIQLQEEIKYVGF